MALLGIFKSINGIVVSLRATERLEILLQNLFTTNISSIKRHFTALELKIKFLSRLLSLQIFQISELKNILISHSELQIVPAA